MDQKSRWKNIIKVILAVISAGTLITAAYLKGASSSGQNTINGSGIIADSLSIKGNENAVAGHDAIVNNNYIDTLPNKGDTYIVNSKGQIGGIAASKVLIYKNITVIKSDDTASKRVKDNFLVTLDTATQIIYLRPKVGHWLHPFIGFSKKEDKNVQPHFSNQMQNILKAEETIFLNGDSLYCMFAKSDPATKDLYYSMRYQALPTYIIFGSYPSTLYKATFK